MYVQWLIGGDSSERGQSWLAGGRDDKLVLAGQKALQDDIGRHEPQTIPHMRVPAWLEATRRRNERPDNPTCWECIVMPAPDCFVASTPDCLSSIELSCGAMPDYLVMTAPGCLVVAGLSYGSLPDYLDAGLYHSCEVKVEKYVCLYVGVPGFGYGLNISLVKFGGGALEQAPYNRTSCFLFHNYRTPFSHLITQGALLDEVNVKHPARVSIHVSLY
jgi:hypothetical protein